MDDRPGGVTRMWSRMNCCYAALVLFSMLLHTASDAHVSLQSHSGTLTVFAVYRPQEISYVTFQPIQVSIQKWKNGYSSESKLYDAAPSIIATPLHRLIVDTSATLELNRFCLQTDTPGRQERQLRDYQIYEIEVFPQEEIQRYYYRAGKFYPLFNPLVVNAILKDSPGKYINAIDPKWLTTKPKKGRLVLGSKKSAQ